MVDSATRLQELSILYSIIDIADAKRTIVYGFDAIFSDNSKITIPDITPNLKLLQALAKKLKQSDVEKVHFVDIIEDFII